MASSDQPQHLISKRNAWAIILASKEVYMKRIRFSVAGLLLSLSLASASGGDEPSGKPKDLPPDEISKGWIKAFDGKTTDGWKIEGDAEVVDGILILGGPRGAKAVYAKKLPEEFEFIYEHRDLGEKTHMLQIKGKRSSASAGGGDADETHRKWTTHRVKNHFPEGRGRKTEWYLWHKGRWIGPGGASGGDRPDQSEVIVEIAAGSKVEIRNFKFRPKKAEEKKQDKGD
jgi:hypothetical protein